MTRNEFYPCQQTLCKFYEEWRIVPEVGALFIGRKSDSEVIKTALTCAICKHFIKKSNLTSR